MAHAGQNSGRARAPAAVAALVAGLALFPAGALAHPHVWVKVQTQVLHDEEGRVTGLRHAWTFDEFYSAFATQGMDKDGDGKLSQAELEPLAAENVSSLQEFDYFTFVKSEGKDETLAQPRDYRLDHVDGILTLHFTLPMKSALDPLSQKVTFSIYDPTFFVAFDFDKTNPVMLASSAPETCQPKFVEAKTAQVKLSEMGEAFYSSLDASSDFASQFAQKVAIVCGAR
jgi:ABC-type uncharacterized transport system substrate-binding protein